MEGNSLLQVFHLRPAGNWCMEGNIFFTIF